MSHNIYYVNSQTANSLKALKSFLDEAFGFIGYAGLNPAYIKSKSKAVGALPATPTVPEETGVARNAPTGNVVVDVDFICGV
ncbi:MAG: hypothetical protein LBC59_00690 [Chitinispirillales bacterium]|jgi:hypothetical protein|nr:hypothetical protein [Chitinispirillales bacterium]